MRTISDPRGPASTRAVSLWMRAVFLWIALSMTGFALAVRGEEMQTLGLVEARVRTLSAELRCVVCDNEPLTEARSSLAEELRGELRLQVERGRSDSEVVEHLMARYGDFVRYRPAMNEGTLILWFGPVMLLMLSLVGLGRLFWRQHLRALSGESTLLGPVSAPREPR